MRYSINILGPHSICNEQESDDGLAMVSTVNQNAFNYTSHGYSMCLKQCVI